MEECHGQEEDTNEAVLLPFKPINGMGEGEEIFI
jgi:hypothetical protein